MNSNAESHSVGPREPRSELTMLLRSTDHTLPAIFSTDENSTGRFFSNVAARRDFRMNSVHAGRALPRLLRWGQFTVIDLTVEMEWSRTMEVVVRLRPEKKVLLPDYPARQNSYSLIAPISA